MHKLTFLGSNPNQVGRRRQRRGSASLPVV